MISLKKVCYWKGISAEGKPVQGIKYDNRYEKVRFLLKQEGIIPIDLHLKWHLVFFEAPIKEKDIVTFTRQLSSLLDSKFSLTYALSILEKQFPLQSSMHQLIVNLQLELEKGIAMSDALKQYNQYFNSLYCSLVQAGEQCGSLTEQLIQLAHHQEALLNIKRKVRKALYYPTILLSVSFLMCTILMIWVVPQFEHLFKEAGAALPLLTQWFIYFSQQLTGTFLLKVLLFIVAVFSLRFYFKEYLIFLNQILLQLPFLGAVVKDALIARICYTLGTTLRSRLPITDAFIIAAETVSEYKNYQLALLKVRHHIIDGIGLDQSLSKHPVFPSLMIQMIAIGQISGQLDQSFLKLGQIFHTQMSEKITWMTDFLEPFLLLVIGIFIGSLMLALYWPIFELGNVIEPV